MAPSPVIAPVVKIDGRELSETWTNHLVDMRVELAFRVPARCTLRFSDPDYEFAESSTATLGNSVEVHARDQGLLISGDITGIAVEHRVGDTPELVVVVHDKGHKLARISKVGTYSDMAFSEVVSKMATQIGMTASVDSTHNVMPYLMQAETDLALLNAMAERTGYDWWVEGTTLHFKKPADSATIDLTMGEKLLSFSVRASGMRPDTMKVAGWDRHKQEVVNGSASLSNAFVKPTSRLVDTYTSSAASKLGAGEAFSANLLAMSEGEADALSAALATKAVASAVTARGVTAVNASIKPGVCVKIDGVGPVTGRYHVTKVEHVFRPTGFETHFTAGERTPTSLVDTLGGKSWGSAFYHNGLVVGLVTNVNDPDKTGKVKVRYPGLASDQESGWARVVSVGAGKNRGAVFLPEVDDEVLLGFEGGDLRQPVVLGGLYGSKSTIPPYDVEDSSLLNRRTTSRLGHFIEFGDGKSEDKQHVLAQLAGGDSKFRLGKDQVDLEVPGGIPIAIKAGSSSLTIGKDGSITLKGKSITIEADESVEVKANKNVTVNGEGGVTVQSNAQTAVKGSMAQLQATGITEIKGSMVKIN